MIKIMFLIPNNIRNIILVVLLTKWLFFREEKTANTFVAAVLKENDISKKW